MWLKAPNISCIHGFSDRQGGFSAAPFDSMNLGGSDDQPELILKNRQKAFSELGLDFAQLCYLKQVHGNHVNLAKPGQQEGDALVSDQSGLVLAVSIADCYPLLFHDEQAGVIGAAHAGWRGTVSLIAEKTIEKMEALGAKRSHIKAAIGQGISAEHFEVGPEVIEQFRQAGFPESVFSGNHIDLVKANRWVMESAGIQKENIWSMNRCTFEPDFFSYRRDKGKTGRMWGLITLQ